MARFGLVGVGSAGELAELHCGRRWGAAHRPNPEVLAGQARTRSTLRDFPSCASTQITKSRDHKTRL
jgi:hypothetical protein